MQLAGARTLPSATRAISLLLIGALVFAVTYLFSGIPFRNPHVGFFGPDHFSIAPIHSAAPTFQSGSTPTEIDDCSVWASVWAGPEFHFELSSGWPLHHLLPLCLSAVWAASSASRAPPGPPQLGFASRGPPSIR